MSALASFIERNSCPVCGASKIKDYLDIAYDSAPLCDHVYRYYKLEALMEMSDFQRLLEGVRYVLAVCHDCRATFQRYIPDSNLSQSVYSEWIRDVDGISVPMGLKAARHYFSEALSLTSLSLATTKKKYPEQLKALDYGLGRGGFARALRACGVEVYGFDFSTKRQDRGEVNGIRMLSQEQITEMKFDLVNTEQVFEHLPYPRDTADTLASTLGTGGLLKISVPYNRWLEGGHFDVDWAQGRYQKSSPMPNAPLEHLQYFRRPSLDRLGESLGLERVRIPPLDHIKNGLDWLGRGAISNLGRAIALDRFRNYYIFKK